MPISLEDLDWKGYGDAALNLLKDGVGDLLEGAAEDIEMFLGDIARDMVVANASGRKMELQHLEAQIRILAAINKVRAAESFNQTLMGIIGVGQDLVLGLLGGINLGGARK